MEILRAKLTPQHAGMLLRDQVLKMDKEWNVLPEDSNNIPYYFFWLMNPDNHAAAQLQHRLLIKQAKSPHDFSYNSLLETLNERDDIYQDDQEWFQRELHDLDVQKENLNEYFYYFQKHKTVSMLKVHDSVHERWAQFSRVNQKETTNESPLNLFESRFTPMQRMSERSHFIVALKILDTEYHNENPQKPPKYNSVGHVAFSTKDQYIEGKVYKVGLAGSGWCAQKYRTQCPSIKFSAWYMKILLMLFMNIRYCYAHVFAENSKSFGYIAKSGMAATRFRLKYLGFNLSLEDHANVSSFDSEQQQALKNSTPQLTHLYKTNSLEEYKTLMDKIYGRSNFLITHLEKIFQHPNFAGCFIDEKAQASFQVWRCKYAIDQKTQNQIPAFIIFNIAHLSQCDIPLTDSQGDQLMTSIRESVIPQLVQDKKLVNLAFATHGGSIYQYLLRNYSHLESISFASLYYTFQDNFKLAGSKKAAQATDPVAKFLMPQQYEAANTNTEQIEEKNLFLDIRDCTSKPMVWSDEIRETEMACIRQTTSSPVMTTSSRSVLPLSVPLSSNTNMIATGQSHQLFASKL